MDGELFEAARLVREKAHAPYSGFPVGAALRTGAGSIHSGCNVENAAFPEGWCAETSAIAAMIAAAADNAGRTIAEVVVVARPIEGRRVTPCGGCRQRLAEFGGPDTIVNAVDPDGEAVDTFSLAELLPAAFALREGS